MSNPPRNTPASGTTDELSYDLEAAKLAATFRPNRKPIFAALAANIVLAALLLGVPYVRGREIAEQERKHFAELTTCLFGGQARHAPGIGLPPGERAHFANQVLTAPSVWPLPCRTPLRALAPEEAIFLWPAVKQAGVDVRATVRLLDQTLVQLHRSRSAGIARVPELPLAALARLQAALTLMAKAAGATDGLDAEALRLPSSMRLPEPARLPLTAAEHAATQLHSTGSALEAIALDGRGVSWLRVNDGKIDRERIKRTSLVRDVIHAGETPYVVWAMPQARCLEREDRCASRATGIAAYARGAHALPKPQWLAGHPAGRIDRSLRVRADQQTELLAITEGPARVELRRFSGSVNLNAPVTTNATSAPPAATPIGTADDAPPTPASAIVPLDLPGSARADMQLTRTGHVLYAFEETGQIGARLRLRDALAQALVLPTSEGRDPFVSSCDAADGSWLFYGGASAQRLVHVDTRTVAAGAPSSPTSGDEAPTPIVDLRRSALKLDAPIDPEMPMRDEIRSVCAEQGSQFFALDAAHTLWIIACTSSEHCEAPRELAGSVASFAVTQVHDTTVLAYSGIAPARELRVLRLDRRGQAQGPARTPAACWEPAGGMCGNPLLVSDGYRVVLATRDGEDLLAIESTDDGAHFAKLSELAGAKPVFQNALDPLRQHRVRKGLE